MLDMKSSAYIILESARKQQNNLGLPIFLVAFIFFPGSFLRSMGSQSETVCVTGASGFIGSWLVMRLLERGYTVRATVRDPSPVSFSLYFFALLFFLIDPQSLMDFVTVLCSANVKKVKHLLDLPKAETHLTLWKADLADEGSFDEAIKGCTGVFHVATPMDFESKDPEVLFSE